MDNCGGSSPVHTRLPSRSGNRTCRRLRKLIGTKFTGNNYIPETRMCLVSILAFQKAICISKKDQYGLSHYAPFMSESSFYSTRIVSSSLRCIIEKRPSAVRRLISLTLSIVDVPFGAQQINIVLYLRVRDIMKFRQEAMQQLATTHSRIRFCWPRQGDVNHLCHQFLIFYGWPHDTTSFFSQAAIFFHSSLGFIILQGSTVSNPSVLVYRTRFLTVDGCFQIR